MFTVTPGMIDSHFHSLEMIKKGLDVEKLMKKCVQLGLSAAIDVGIRADDLQARKRMIGSIEEVYFSAGIHPGESKNEDVLYSLETLKHTIVSNSVVALGEIGLDWYRNHGTPARQKALFIEQLDLSNELSLPVIIHNRNADQEVLDILSDHKPVFGGIMHCFSSEYATAKKCIDLGFLISFAGNVTYNNAHSIRETAGKIPLDSILVETDAPYLSPQKYRGNLNFSGHIGEIYAEISRLHHILQEDLIVEIHKNFCNFIRSTHS